MNKKIQQFNFTQEQNKDIVSIGKSIKRLLGPPQGIIGNTSGKGVCKNILNLASEGDPGGILITDTPYEITNKSKKFRKNMGGLGLFAIFNPDCPVTGATNYCYYTLEGFLGFPHNYRLIEQISDTSGFIKEWTYLTDVIKKKSKGQAKFPFLNELIIMIEQYKKGIIGKELLQENIKFHKNFLKSTIRQFKILSQVKDSRTLEKEKIKIEEAFKSYKKGLMKLECEYYSEFEYYNEGIDILLKSSELLFIISENLKKASDTIYLKSCLTCGYSNKNKYSCEKCQAPLPRFTEYINPQGRLFFIEEPVVEHKGKIMTYNIQSLVTELEEFQKDKKDKKFFLEKIKKYEDLFKIEKEMIINYSKKVSNWTEDKNGYKGIILKSINEGLNDFSEGLKFLKKESLENKTNQYRKGIKHIINGSNKMYFLLILAEKAEVGCNKK